MGLCAIGWMLSIYVFNSKKISQKLVRANGVWWSIEGYERVLD